MSLNTLDDPFTEVTVLDTKPPVHDSHVEIVIFFLINVFTIFFARIVILESN